MLVRVREMPAVDVDLAIAAVDFDDRRDQRDDPAADLLDVRALVDRQAIDELHQRSRRSGFRRVNRTGDVVDRHRLIDELVGLGVVRADRARIGELGQPRAVLVELRQVGFRRDRDRDHLAAFFGLADGEHLDPRAGLLDHPHVLRRPRESREASPARRRCRRAPPAASARSSTRDSTRSRSRSRSRPGVVNIRFGTEGSHNVAISGPEVIEPVLLGTAAGSPVEVTRSPRVAAGTYKYYCAVPGHQKAMSGTFTVG